MFCALKAALERGAGHNVVAVCPGGVEKYLDTVYDDQWLAGNGFAAASTATADDVIRHTAGYRSSPGSPIRPYRVFPVR